MRLRGLVFIGYLVFLSINGTSQVSCNLNLIATPVNASCDNACNGSVVLNPSGGTAPYSFNAFDHSFNTSSIDLTLFDLVNGNFFISTPGRLTAAANTSINSDYKNSIATKQAFPDNGKLLVEASLFIDYNAYAYFGLALNETPIENRNQLSYAFFFSNSTLFIYHEGSPFQVSNYSNSTWYDFKIEKLGNTVNYYMRNTGVSTYTLISSKPATLNNPNYKLAALYRNLVNGTPGSPTATSRYGGFSSTNWRVGGNPPTTGLCPGTYTYTVFDALGCFATANVTLGSGGANSVQLNGTVTAASCGAASDGAINLTPTGGTGPYSYGFAHVFQGGSINTNIFELRNGNFSQGTDLRQGTNYNNPNGWDNSISTKQSFSDGGYLVMDASFKFDANAEVIFGFTSTGVINDYAKMLAGFRIMNGTQLFAYNKTAGLQQVGSITSETWYDFRIEKLGSIVNFYSRAHNTGSYALLYTTTYPTTNIEFKAAALNFAGFFSSSGGYNTKGWNIQSTPKVTELSPGTYTYTITDANGCTATSVFNIGASGNNTVTLNAGLLNGTIANAATGAVSLTPTGGTAPYSYTLVPDFSGTVINEAILKPLNGNFIQASGSIRANNTNISIWDNSLATNLTFIDGGKLTLTGSFSFDANPNSYFGFTNNATLIDPSQIQIGFYITGTELYARSGSNTSLIGSSLISANTWYDLKVEKTGALVRYYIRNNGIGSFNLVYTMPYYGTMTEFRAGVLMFGTSGGFNTNGWSIDCNPPLTGLSAGIYTYRVYDSKGCFGLASVNVPVSSTITLNAQGNNTTAWNVCDGSVTLTTTPSNNFDLASKLLHETFTGMQLNANVFDRRNGAFTQNDALISANTLIGNGWDNSVVTKNAYPDNGMIIAEMEMNFKPGAEVYFGFASAYQTITSYNNLPFAFAYQSGKLAVYSAQTGNIIVGNISANQWHGFKIVKKGSLVLFYLRYSSGNRYELLHTVTTSETGLNYKAGIVNFFGLLSGFDRGFSSRNWKVFNQATTTNLCQGNYSYTVLTNGNTLAEANATVETSLSLVQTMVGPADLVINTDATKSFATGVNLGSPTFGGPTTGITISNDGPVQYPLGITNVLWIATDGVRTVTGIQKVTVVDNEDPFITAPADLNLTLFAGQAVVTGVMLGNAVATDNVPGVVVTNDAPSQFPLGNTTITWTAIDAAGNTATATQIVSVTATPLPTVTAPANITVATDPNQSFASGVNLGSPTLGNNAQGITITNNAPAQFAVGTTTVTWTISDGLGNSATATQQVTVIDSQPPTITVPAGITISTNTGVSYATAVNLGNAVANDNVAGVLITNNAPSQYPVGTTIVTWTATDAAGNTVTATQTVTVIDNELPTITAPANVTVYTDAGLPTASNVALGTATIADNVGASPNNNALSIYPIGTTIVTWTATDAAGNTAAATQTVTVIDNELPTITAPANVTVTISLSQTYATVILGTPVFADNAPGASISNNAPTQFPVGTTTVTWTVTDAAGNSNTGTQTVTVNVVSQPPVAKCKTVEITLVNGQAILSPSQVDDGSAAAAGIADMTLSKTMFGCNDIGINTVNFTVTDNNGLSSTCTTTINVIGEVPTVSISSIPTITAYTGGLSTTLYIGYGAQSTKLQVNAPSSGAPYTYSWIGSGLSSTTAENPIFTPTEAGNFVIIVTVKNKFGCTSSASINICVKDIRVSRNGKKDNKKVYVCHIPPGNPANVQTLEVSISAVAAHLAHGCSLGSCNQACGTEAKGPIVESEQTFDVKVSPNPTSNYFVVQVQSSERSNKVSVRVMDAFGRTIKRESLSVGTVLKFGENFANGTYYLEAVQGTEKQVIKLLKM